MVTVALPDKALLGMVHVGALAGTPGNTKTVAEIVKSAVQEAWVLAEGGCDGIVIENMHDIPYLRREVGPEIVAAMTLVCSEIRKATTLPCGVQVLAGANEAALAVALTAELDFVRVEGFVFGHVADEGWMDACAGPLMRYRKQIGAEHIAVWADIKKKHSAHAVTADVSLAETVKAAEFFGADGIIITGESTGRETSTADLALARGATKLPIIVGSGVTPRNTIAMLEHADALIVGSSIKNGGIWSNSVELSRVKEIVSVANTVR